jgi:predicted metal-dependent phosphoesterase TrpH
MIKGAIHVHSTYSDGEFTLAELREVYLAAGCSFACMNDHAECFDESSLQAYRRECEALSDEKFRLIAGLEYRCLRDMHITAYGFTGLTNLTDPEAIIRYIGEQGGTAVIAHPKNEFFPWIESFQTLPDGIEAWNSKYDGRYAPRPGTFALLQKLKQRNPAMLAFYGQDLHWKNQFHGLFLEMELESAEPQAVWACIAGGKFHGRKGELRLPSDGVLPEQMLAQFGDANARSHRFRNLLSTARKALGRLGIRVPESVKAPLRKIF